MTLKSLTYFTRPTRTLMILLALTMSSSLAHVAFADSITGLSAASTAQATGATRESTPLTAIGQAMLFGGFNGGGGDVSEMGVDQIRADLLSWIQQGGAKGLKLPRGITTDLYAQVMSKYLAPHFVVIGFVTTAQDQKATDPEQKVKVAGEAKACRGFISSRDHAPHILCNSDRYPKNGAEQYRLVHHEFAGLAGMEKNIGASSDYQISEQLTDFLVPETILRLSVKKNADTPEPIFTHVQSGDMVSCMDDNNDRAIDLMTKALAKNIVAMLAKKHIYLNPAQGSLTLTASQAQFQNDGVNAIYGYFMIDENALVTADGTVLGVELKQTYDDGSSKPNSIDLKTVVKSSGFDREGNAINPHCTLISDDVRVDNRADYLEVTNAKTGRSLGRVDLPTKIILY